MAKRRLRGCKWLAELIQLTAENAVDEEPVTSDERVRSENQIGYTQLKDKGVD